MTTADWAFVISIGSFVIAILSFVWNIWSKFIYPKARVRPTIAIMKSAGRGESGREFLTLSATNYGPTDVTLHTAISRKKRSLISWKVSTECFILQPLDSADSNTSSGPFSGGLPKKLVVGEQFSVFFPGSAAKEWVKEDKLSDYGFCDTFGRNHWCSKREIKEFEKQASSQANQLA